MYAVANPDPNPRGWGQLPGCGVTGEQDIVLGKIIFLQCIVFCVGPELNRRDRV